MTAPVISAGYFPQAARALAFLGALTRVRPTHAPIHVRRAPEGWWVEIEDARQTLTPLIQTAGGRPFSAVQDGWMPVSGYGPACSDTELTSADWPLVELAALLAASPLPAGKPEPTTELILIIPPALSRWVLRRALAANLRVELAPIVRRPLATEDVETRAWLVTLRGKAPIPAALLRPLGDLPDTLVGRFDSRAERVLLDVRCRCPLSETALIAAMPATGHWALGTPDVGHWCFQRMGEAVDGVTFLQAPAPAVIPLASRAPDSLPAPIPVRLIRRRERQGPCDAVLLDETELRGLTRFLATRPCDEVAFLLPGAGRYLLTAPGGLGEALPFGIPLARIDPGGLYLEQGLTLHPPLPAGARRDVFKVDERRVAAAVAEGIFSFEIRHCLPAWALWVGQAPPVQSGLTARGEQILHQVSDRIRAAAAHQFALTITPATLGQDERSYWLEQAQQAEWAGDWVRAAELLEAAGEPARAARLYERAARQMEWLE